MSYSQAQWLMAIIAGTKGDRDKENHDSRAVQAKKLARPCLK
jgi:hypothetical protein